MGNRTRLDERGKSPATQYASPCLSGLAAGGATPSRRCRAHAHLERSLINSPDLPSAVGLGSTHFEFLMTSSLAILAIGFVLGMRHATDPDHVIAVSTIVSREPSL